MWNSLSLKVSPLLLVSACAAAPRVEEGWGQPESTKPGLTRAAPWLQLYNHISIGPELWLWPPIWGPDRCPGCPTGAIPDVKAPRWATADIRLPGGPFPPISARPLMEYIQRIMKMVGGWLRPYSNNIIFPENELKINWKMKCLTFTI